MDVPGDLSVYFTDDPIQRLDKAMLIRLNPRKCWIVKNTINDIGALSTAAQGLKKALTTYEKIIDADDGQVIYLMWKKNPNNENASIIIGLLKIGYKKLYLMDSTMNFFQTTPLCVLDFYVHDSLQRQGYGHALFDYMLQQEKSSAEMVAIDKPSQSLLQFMDKHYGLNEPIWQVTNFVVYPPFFQNIKPYNDAMHPAAEPVQQSPRTEIKNENVKHIQGSRRFLTPGRDVMGDLLRDDVETVEHVDKDQESAHGRKAPRNFEHHSIW